MKSWIVFGKKELLEQLRSGRVMILGILFVLYGVMNPATAKLTPWLLEAFSDSLADGGMTITIGQVSALDSWVQFFKNMPIFLIAFAGLEGGVFTREYESGTLVLSLTKGMGRGQILLAKSTVLLIGWTVGYWMAYGITYLYSAYYWDNAVAQSLLFAAAGGWLLGVWIVLLLVFFSACADTSAIVLLGCGGVVLLSSFLGIIPPIADYLPTQLADGQSLIYGLITPSERMGAMGITAVLSIACLGASIPIFRKRQL